MYPHCHGMCDRQDANGIQTPPCRCPLGLLESKTVNEDKGLGSDMATEHETAMAKSDAAISDEMKVTFGQNCKAARLQAGMSQGQLAALLRFPQSMLSNIESGRVNITIQTMVSIARALQVELAQLVGTPPQE